MCLYLSCSPKQLDSDSSGFSKMNSKRVLTWLSHSMAVINTCRIPAMFRGPSWVDRSCVPLRSPASEETFEPRRARGRSTLPAPLPGWPRKEPESSLHCLPAEIGPLVTCRTVLPLPAPQRGRDRATSHSRLGFRAVNPFVGLWGRPSLPTRTAS
jgi:hypothetical protein